jgi:hypothetical protein
MRELFPGYYRPSEEEFKILWEKCVFVPDANVLLNLYRYPVNARKDFLGVLKKIKERIWVPHQVILEFQRNRLKVITDTLRPIAELINEIGNINQKINAINENITANQIRGLIGEIDPKGFKEKTKEGLCSLRDQLDSLNDAQMKLFDSDPIRKELEDLFINKMCPPPTDQSQLNKIYEEGELRYQKKIPPGYLDQAKDRLGGDSEEFLYGGLLYKRKFGDLILWKQLVNHAKEQKIEYLIFITDDRKEDWWWKEECHGSKTIGPRPELVEEIKKDGGVSLFYSYPPDRFLEYAQKHLQVKITPVSLQYIREISKPVFISDGPWTCGSPDLEEVYGWVYNRHPNAQINLNQEVGPELEVSTNNGERIGYEVKIVRSGNPSSILLKGLDGGVNFKKLMEFDRLYLILVLKQQNFDKTVFQDTSQYLVESGFDGVFVGQIITEPSHPDDPCPNSYFKVLMKWQKGLKDV